MAVLPNSARADISAKFTSPLKLFEYLASSRPVVATDVPAVREIVGDADCVHLVEPDNPRALADGLKRVVSDDPLRDRITANASRMVRGYS
ncbi:MAG: glycosyltransferase, partial [Planctomycetes bacterium]|nr:glycosyltransferase [Planctomycetota bacterium]